jgi:predicted DNA-binding protein (MmcQ/YjbR family)
MKKPPVEEPRLARVTKIAGALPEAVREIHGSHATFLVRKKVFAYFLNDHHGDGIVSLGWRTARGENLEWVKLDPSRFYLPAYIGPRGWAAVRLDVGRVDWGEVAAFVTESYRLAAPKRLAALMRERSL